MKAPVKQVVAVVTREITVRSAENILNLIETDQVAPAGRWRLRLDGDKIYFDRATAADWSTYETWLTYDKANEKLTVGKLLELADGKSIKLEETLGTDHTWCGLTCDGTAGEDLAIGEVCYLKSDGKFWKSDADAAATMPVVAMATAAISADASGVFLLMGFYRDDTWNWTIGGFLYASTTAGAMTQTAPSGSGDQVQKVGIALTADIVYFNPDITIVEI